METNAISAAAWVAILLSTLRVSTPLVLTAMGGLMSERSGVVNLALEGFMTVGAFAGAGVAYATHSPWWGAAAGLATGVALAALYAFFVISLRADQIVAGTAINLLAFGLTPLATNAFFDSNVATPALPLADRFQWQPMAMALVAVVAIWFWLRKFRLGLWLQFAGEHPHALEAAGVRVVPVRWFGVLASGALAGLGGVALSIFLSSSYSRGMTAGRGFMALAALIFGKWRPIPTLFACLFFGLSDALQIQLQGVVLWGTEPVPVQFIQVMPYALTVLVLAGFVGKSRAPKALGQPWKSVAMLAIASAAALGLSGCDCRLEGARLTCNPPEAKGPSETNIGVRGKGISSEAGRRAKANAELLHEVIEVVLQTEIRDRAVFGSYVEAMNQGASLEGMLNGFTHSAAYRERERRSPPASRDQFLFFTAEMMGAMTEMKRPPELYPEMGKPLADVDYPTGAATASSPRKSAAKPARAAGQAPSPAELAEITRKIASVFAASSAPTLKRVLADTWIEWTNELAAEPTRLAAWYGQTAARLGAQAAAAKPPVDFGLKLRNNPDAAFHEKWAADWLAKSPEEAKDRILWESLNRFHRLMNAAAPAKKE